MTATPADGYPCDACHAEAGEPCRPHCIGHPDAAAIPDAVTGDECESAPTAWTV